MAYSTAAYYLLAGSASNADVSNATLYFILSVASVIGYPYNDGLDGLIDCTVWWLK